MPRRRQRPGFSRSYYDIVTKPGWLQCFCPGVGQKWVVEGADSVRGVNDPQLVLPRSLGFCARFFSIRVGTRSGTRVRRKWSPLGSGGGFGPGGGGAPAHPVALFLCPRLSRQHRWVVRALPGVRGRGYGRRRGFPHCALVGNLAHHFRQCQDIVP